jgi:hypothetical protein
MPVPSEGRYLRTVQTRVPAGPCAGGTREWSGYIGRRTDLLGRGGFVLGVVFLTLSRTMRATSDGAEDASRHSTAAITRNFASALTLLGTSKPKRATPILSSAISSAMANTLWPAGCERTKAKAVGNTGTSTVV